MMERIEQSMEGEPGSREHAIAVYRTTINQAAQLGAARNDPDVVRRHQSCHRRRPVEPPTGFYLHQPGTAGKLGLPIPPSLLVEADDVIN